MLTIAHLSDIHLGQVHRRDGGKRARRRAEQVMAYLNALPGPLDAVLATGDLADHGLPEEYEQVAKVLTSRHPVLTCPGNHDRRAPYRAVLLGGAAHRSPPRPRPARGVRAGGEGADLPA
ncbi:metallophosphoesterase, partial [Streptomyces novaecaesareae]|uniref:metallophosphoesterase n=1 Tax=Streptomyces novaecaesareae TaxID=68244 RepID=UPI001AE051F9